MKPFLRPGSLLRKPPRKVPIFLSFLAGPHSPYESILEAVNEEKKVDSAMEKNASLKRALEQEEQRSARIEGLLRLLKGSSGPLPVL